MIKNLLNADEDPPPGIKVVVEETVLNPPTQPPRIESPTADQPSEIAENRQDFVIPEDTRFFTEPIDDDIETEAIDDDPESFTNAFAEPLIDESEIIEEAETETEDQPIVEQISDNKPNYETSGTLFQSEVKPQSASETIRQSGMAYSAAIILFGSIVFMMILGWFADLLLGSAPWGIVGGIILGAIIGFIQFFRITSQIFKK